MQSQLDFLFKLLLLYMDTCTLQMIAIGFLSVITYHIVHKVYMKLQNNAIVTARDAVVVEV